MGHRVSFTARPDPVLQGLHPAGISTLPGRKSFDDIIPGITFFDKSIFCLEGDKSQLDCSPQGVGLDTRVVNL